MSETVNHNSPYGCALWVSKDGMTSYRWDLVATTKFYANTESRVTQRDFPGTPDIPMFYGDKTECRYQDALDAFAAWKQYHNVP